MTSLERDNLVGKRGWLDVPKPYKSTGPLFVIGVRILDARSAYGRIDVLVEPESGEGQAWVSADRVKVRPS